MDILAQLTNLAASIYAFYVPGLPGVVISVIVLVNSGVYIYHSLSRHFKTNV